MEAIKAHFEEEARVFDATIVRLIPHYDSMIDALVSALPFPAGSRPKILDLGCGTGTVSARVFGRYPDAKITCLDIAENMLGMARAKLNPYNANAEFVLADFSDWIPPVRYDAVVSSLALHHLPDDGAKRAFFSKVHESLSPGGCFLNADVVLSGDPQLQSMYLRKWRSFMIGRDAGHDPVSAEEADEKWFPSYEREDRPAVLSDQLDWLGTCGFAVTDVIWKHYNFAVYGGKKA